MLKGEYNLFPFGSRMEKVVTDIEIASILEAMLHEYSLIIDATNFRLDMAWINQLVKLYNYKLEIVDFTHVDIKTCIQRDQQREFPVGKNIIEGMAVRYLDYKKE